VPAQPDALREDIETLQLGPRRTLQISLDPAQNTLSFEPSPSEKRETFCVMPWLYLQLLSHGKIKPCCKFKQFVTKDGAPMSVYKQSLAEIWNSDEMRSIRRAMVHNERLPGCVDCYEEEDSGGISLRKARNRDWQNGWLNEQNIDIDVLKARAISNDGRVRTTPSFLQLDVGNLCNLKCRMCQGYSSSQIDRDPVHRQWNGAAPLDKERLPTGKRWFEDKDFILTELLQDPDQIKLLQFLGGETLLIKEIRNILEILIGAGVAQNITLLAATNGTVIKSPWLDLAERFKQLSLNVSLDGFGKYYEYIRFPARWLTVTRNIETLRQRSKTWVMVIATLQMYNALNIVELFEYLDSVELDFYAYPVAGPGYLSPKLLPPRARQLAIKRLSSYAETGCLPKNRELVMGLAKGLEKPGDLEAFDQNLMRAFMLFTNDLDTTRGQSFRSTHDELLQLITDAGFKWTNETFHA
jgi:MoaA/NifB/PqqE/SkfB family radical SAM enzyme